MGATWYRRVSRNLRSTSYSAAKPYPPWVWMQASAAAQAASDASNLAILASAPAGLPASYRSAACLTISAAASVWMCALAMGNCTPWLAPMGRPNTSRSLA